MAKKKKSDAEPGEEGQATPRMAKKKMMMIGGGALAVLALAGGGYFMFLKPKPDSAAMARSDAAQSPGATIDLEEMKISLASGPGEDRQAFLKMKVALEVADENAVKLVQPLIPRVVDSFQTFMRELRPADLEGSAGIYRLKEEMMRRINVAVYPNKVDAILFKELLVQ